jgi:multidrug efflux pump subunit AcrA (membrane-fusion protein)
MGFTNWLESNKTGSEKDLARKQKYMEVKAKNAARSADRAAARRDDHLAQLDKKAAKGASFEGVTLAQGQVHYQGQGGSVRDAKARVESAADVRRRVTATRVLAIGVFALVAKKAAGHVYLTVEAPGYEFMVEVPVKKEADARAFAASINNAARHTT